MSAAPSRRVPNLRAVTAKQPSKFPEVERAHIVPKAYLRFFAVGNQIGLRLVARPHERLVTSIDKAAVRRRFYRRKRPDGTEIDDVEWSMSHIESALPPILRGIENRWPLTDGDKALLAEFFALQFVRSPAFAAWQRRRAEEAVAEWDAEGRIYLRSGKTATPEERERVIDLLGGEPARLPKMLSHVPKGASVFGSMHWSLVRFEQPVLGTSDHPVVRWPIAEWSREPTREPDILGLMELLEVRVALTPTLALLMTWLDAPDTPEPIDAATHHAVNLNSFVVAQAETQWFHRPGTTPRTGSGRFLPVSGDLVTEYSQQVALASRRRQRVQDDLNRRIGHDFEREFQIVTVRQNTAGDAPR